MIGRWIKLTFTRQDLKVYGSGSKSSIVSSVILATFSISSLYHFLVNPDSYAMHGHTIVYYYIAVLNNLIIGLTCRLLIKSENLFLKMLYRGKAIEIG